MAPEIPPEDSEKGLSIYAVIVAVVISIFVGVSATYIALMISALPWPIILSVVISFSSFKFIDIFRKRKHTIHEVNVAQAGGSIGGLVAAGVVFTIPAFWYLNEIFGLDLDPPSIFQIVVIAIVGGLLGVALSLPVRKLTIDEENLPFPSGYAGAQTLIAAEEGGIKGSIVLMFGIMAAIFACIVNGIFGIGLVQLFIGIKDGHIYVSVGSMEQLMVIGAIIIPLFLLPLLVGVGAGYILGKNTSLSWFFGALLGWGVLMPILQVYGWIDFFTPVQNLGIGIVFGAGLAFFLLRALPSSGKIYRTFIKHGDIKEKRSYMYMPIVMSVIAFVCLVAIGIDALVAILGVLGTWIMATIAGKTTGETNIDPLEQFGLMVGLFIMFFLGLLGLAVSISQAILIVAFVAVATAVAGDIGHDYKSAKVIGTRPIDIAYADAIACVVGGIISPIAMIIVLSAYYDYIIFTPGVAFQMKLVAGVLYAFKYPSFFLVGLALGFLGESIIYLLEKKNKKIGISIMPFGIGMFLGFALAIPVVTGGIIRAYISSKKPKYEELGILAVSGIMGGEGIMGFTLGLLAVGGVNIRLASITIIAMLILITIMWCLRGRK